jgi:hypothetical protein
VKSNEWRAAVEMLKEAGSSVEDVVSKAMMKVSNEAVKRLQKSARAGAFGPPKKRGSGPPLIDTGNYIDSWKVTQVSPFEADIGPTGQNTYLSNQALGTLLEYGTKTMPARPHMRSIARWMDKTGHKRLGKEVRDGLFGRS